MAEVPSPSDDPCRTPPDRPDNVIGLVSETLGDDKRTNNLIRLIRVVAPVGVAAVVLAAVAVFYVLVLLTKGVHGLENRLTWIAGGVVGAPSLVSLVIWARRMRNGGTVRDDAIDEKQSTPPPVGQSRTQTLQENIPRQARQPRRQRRPSRRR